MLLRLFTTAFAARFAERSSKAAPASLERALIGTGVALATSRQRRRTGAVLLLAGAMLGWRRRQRGG